MLSPSQHRTRRYRTLLADRLLFLVLGRIARSDHVNKELTLIYLQRWSGGRAVYYEVGGPLGSTVGNLARLDWELLEGRALVALEWEAGLIAEPMPVRRGALYRRLFGRAWHESEKVGRGLVTVIRAVDADGRRYVRFRVNAEEGSAAYRVDRREIRRLRRAVERALAWREGSAVSKPRGVWAK